MDLGRLEKIDLRKLWLREDSDFTEWLSKPENLELLSNELGIEIESSRTERSVGRYRVDILAKEEKSDRQIIIENQLEKANHDHLGKIITYASGSNAEVIIWIVSEYSDEHKEAVDWLNKQTDDKINFFLIKLEAWQIDNSKPAPKFQIVSKIPDYWEKSKKNSSLTPIEKTQLEFWKKFEEYAKEKRAELKLSPLRPTQWYVISIGSSKANIVLRISRDQIGCRLNVHDSKGLYDFLLQKKDAIEAELGFKLQWDELSTRKASKISVVTEGDFRETEKWEGYLKWCLEKSVKFNNVFPNLIKNFREAVT